MNKKSKVVSYNKWGYIFLIPFVVVYLVFQMVPLVTTVDEVRAVKKLVAEIKEELKA